MFAGGARVGVWHGRGTETESATGGMDYLVCCHHFQRSHRSGGETWLLIDMSYISIKGVYTLYSVLSRVGHKGGEVRDKQGGQFN